MWLALMTPERQSHERCSHDMMKPPSDVVWWTWREGAWEEGREREAREEDTHLKVIKIITWFTLLKPGQENRFALQSCFEVQMGYVIEQSLER